MKMNRRTWISCLALIPPFLSSCRDKKVPGANLEGPVQEKPGNRMKGENPDSDQSFIGLTEVAGVALAERRALKHRTVSIDGRALPATRDYRQDRVNFEIEQGLIVRVSRG